MSVEAPTDRLCWRSPFLGAQSRHTESQSGSHRWQGAEGVLQSGPGGVSLEFVLTKAQIHHFPSVACAKPALGLLFVPHPSSVRVLDQEDRVLKDNRPFMPPSMAPCSCLLLPGRAPNLTSSDLLLTCQPAQSPWTESTPHLNY